MAHCKTARQLSIYLGALAGVVCMIPATSQAQSLMMDFQGNCNALVEVAFESGNLVHTSGEEVQGEVTLHTHTSLGHVDRRCGEAVDIQARITTSCEASDGERFLEGETQDIIFYEQLKPGFDSWALPFIYSVSEPARCRATILGELQFQNGSRQALNTQFFIEPIITIQKVAVSSLVRESHEDLTSRSGEYTPFTVELNAFVDQDAEYSIELSQNATVLRGFEFTSSLLGVTWSDERCELFETPSELVACSSDEFPVCGTDGKVWSSVCEATRAGVGVCSESPHHDFCQRDLKLIPYKVQGDVKQSFHEAPQDKPTEQLTCADDLPINMLGSQGRFAQGFASYEGLVRANPLSPSYLVPWEALVRHNERDVYGVQGVVRQDIEAFPERCRTRSYRMSSCSGLDPCCGQDTETCDVEAQLAVWCPFFGDSDCDGLPDEMELRSDPLLMDSDGDGLDDYQEHIAGTNPSMQDTDGDGLSDYEEWQRGLSPIHVDSDLDGVPDDADPDPWLADADHDGVLDGMDLAVFDPDADRDGLMDGLDPDPFNADTDGDGLLDGAEVLLGLDPEDVSDGMSVVVQDSDLDGLSDEEEASIGTDPDLADTDFDGLSDLHEVFFMSNALGEDTDFDGVLDGEEVFVRFTDPVYADSDYDGLSDGEELSFGTHPWLEDTDLDGLTDREEAYTTVSDATRRDSDGGGAEDFVERLHTGKNDSAADDAVQQRELVHQGPLEAVFFKGGDAPIVRLSAEYIEQAESELLLGRVVEMPYHHMMHVFEARGIDDQEDILQLRVTPELQGFDAEDVVLAIYYIDSNKVLSVRYVERGDTGRQLEILMKINLEQYDVLSDRTSVMDVPLSLEGPDEDGVITLTMDTDFYQVDRYVKRVRITSVVNMHSVLPERCTNNLDDDLNGLTDCQDPACEEECFGSFKEVCNDGFDNDFDGWTDCEDLNDCAEECVDFEICDNGFDDDFDGRVDLADPYCENYCDNGFCDEPEEICDNGFDDDFDGDIDELDEDCVLEDCQDGVDNDLDGYTDCLDDKCSMSVFCCADLNTCGGEICNDGFDNDFDDLIDCLDDECATTLACAVPGRPPRRSIGDRLSDGCGCIAVGAPAKEALPYELLCAVALCGVGVLRRRRRRRR